MADSPTTARQGQYARSAVTREKILDVAERLFTEQGISATSKRQLTEEAGQSNNAAVDYHFGSWQNLVSAVLQRHVVDVEQRRERMLAELPEQPGLRELIRCMVQPYTDHLAALPQPSWYARLSLQVLADPQWRTLAVPLMEDSPTERAAVELALRHAQMPSDDVKHERIEMGSLLVLHMCADRERALQHGLPTPRKSWADAGGGLVDAITALWLGPVS
jgi:AcrR family transcriptional regulator